MGTIRANSDLTGFTVAGILLGAAAMDADGLTYVWDDDRLPNIDIVVPANSPDDELLMALLGGAS